MIYHKIPIFLTKDKLPPVAISVIVAGGVAYYNGECWITNTGDDSGRKIEWEVKWWTPILGDESIRKEQEYDIG